MMWYIIIGICIAITVICALIYARISADTRNAHGYIAHALDQLLGAYYQHLVAHKGDIQHFSESSDVFGRAIRSFLAGNHRTTSDFHRFAIDLREDSAYLAGITDADVEIDPEITSGLTDARQLIGSLTPVLTALRRVMIICSVGTFVLRRPLIDNNTIYKPVAVTTP